MREKRTRQLRGRRRRSRRHDERLGSGRRDRGELENWISRSNWWDILTGEEGEPSSQNGRGDLTNRTDDGGRMGRLKLLNIRAVVDNDRVAVSCRKSHDGPNWTSRKNASRIVVETVRLVDVARDR